MKIKRLELQNFRSAAKITFDFTDRLNLFVGVNGSGKSTILDALSICLSWLVKRIERKDGQGTPFPDASLRNDQTEAFLNIRITEKNNSYRWFLTQTAKGRPSDLENRLDGVNKLAEALKVSHEQEMIWPVIAYYPINRTVETVRPEIPDRDSLHHLEVYENALDGKTDYQSFFEWFRVQDDILNENAMSRSRWMRQNRKWIDRRVSRLSDLLKEAVLPDDHQHFEQENLRYLLRRLEKDEIIYEDSRFLLHELFQLFNMIGMSSHNDLSRYEIILSDLKRMFRMFSSELRDNLIGKGGLHEELTERIIRNFDHIRHDQKSDDKIVEFLWESFCLAILLSLWWMSDKGKRDMELEFETLKKASAQDSIPEKRSSALQQIITQELRQKKNAYRYEGQDLHIVIKAIEQFVPEYSRIRVKRVPRPCMRIDKNGESFNLEQLSDGEKNLIALMGDIARRLAIANPRRDNPLEGEGMILIDEIDLHLHPRWQRLVIPKLLDVFPNCQFFISTHSPQIISHVQPENIFLLEQAEEGLNYRKAEETYGMSLDRIVELVMDDESRPVSVRDDLDKLFEFIERRKLVEAKQLLSKLKKDMQTDPELMRAETLIRREEMRG